MCVLMATPAPATPKSLGWWNEGDPGTTHQEWHFTNAKSISAPPYNWEAVPEDTDNHPTFVQAYIDADRWSPSGSFYDNTSIMVSLEIENYPALNKYKELWVDIGYTGTLTGINANGVTVGVNHDEYYLPGPGPSGEAEFGYLIIPNPYQEDIWFTINALAGESAVLDYIHVDTICIPEPATLLLLGGAGLVGWLRRKRTL